MERVSSNFSLINVVEEKMFNTYENSSYSAIKEFSSRIIGLFLSPAALLDVVIHGALLSVTCIFAVGRSIYLCRPDFLLPWQHLQRIRDAIFPLLFGSSFALLHPYLGVYAAEPVKKHIAVGTLLSNNKKKFDVVCSPISSLKELLSHESRIDHSLRLSPKEKKSLEKTLMYEGEWQKVQSIDFFFPNLTQTLHSRMINVIDQAKTIPTYLKELVKRITIITYPILVAIDFLAMIFISSIYLGSLATKLLGGSPPAYLEKASSFEVTLCTVCKIALVVIGAILGLLTLLISPKTGSGFIGNTLQAFRDFRFNAKMDQIKDDLRKMEKGDQMIIPSAMLHKKRSILPTHDAHMRYLLMEKVSDSHFVIELIERGPSHAKTHPLTLQECEEVLEKTMLRRFAYAEEQSVYQNKEGIIDLGMQPYFSNCVITNLFATIEVLYRQRGPENLFLSFCKNIKYEIAESSSLYAFDFYPFGKTAEIIEEIENLHEQKI